MLVTRGCDGEEELLEEEEDDELLDDEPKAISIFSVSVIAGIAARNSFKGCVTGSKPMRPKKLMANRIF